MEFFATNKTIANCKRHNFGERVRRLCFLFALFSVCFSNNAQAAISHDQRLTWQTLTSKHFELHYHNGEQGLAVKTLNIAERVLKDLQPTFNWIPKDRIEIILSDEIDTSNGFVIAPFLPALRITLYPTHPDDINDVDDWLELLITHELTHALHIDKADGTPLILRKLFGRHPLSFPNILQPAWLLEGLATYLETDKSRWIGRGQDDIYQMLMRMEVKNGIKSYEEVNLPTANWPAGITRYLYGVHFYQFLEAQYSRASINRFIADYSNNLTPFALNTNSIRTYGKTMPELWEDFEAYLLKIYLPQFASISDKELVEGERITKNGFFKYYLQPLENGNLIYAQYDGKTRPSLQIKKPKINKTETIAEIRSDARLDYHPKAGVIVSQIEMYRNTNYLYDLFKINIKEKDIERITRGDRFRRAIWNPEGNKIIAVYNKNNEHTLALLNTDGQLIDLIWEGKSGEFIADLDWSHDGKYLVASVKRALGGWNIEKFSLEKRKWVPLISAMKNEVQPRFSADGRRILFSANYTGVYNIYAFDIKTKKITQISNVEGGAFRPVTDKNGRLYYIGYTHQGFDVFKIENIKAVQENVNPKKQELRKKITYPPVPFEQTDYTPFARISPTWWTPIFAFAADNNETISQIGGYVTGSDALNIHRYDAALSFNLESNTISSALNYTYDRWFPVIQTHLSTIDKVDKHQEIYHLEVLAPLLLREKRWYFGITARNENLKYKNIKSGSNEKDYLIGFGLVYDTTKNNIISNSPSNGRIVTVTAETSELLGSDFNGKMIITKWQEYIALKPEQVLAFRFISGLGLENPRNFQLGGNFNNGNYFTYNPFSTVPFTTKLYNQRQYSLRGYPVTAPSLYGRRMMLYNLEWRFPIKRIEKSASSFPIGIQQISGATFIESGTAWNSGLKPVNFHYSIGAEAKFHTNFFYSIPSIIRAGYAYGANEDGEHQVYLGYGTTY